MIKFDSDVGSFSTFDAVGGSFIKMMGHSGSMPSATMADGVGMALDSLRRAMSALPDETDDAAPASDDDGEKVSATVPLRRRTFALVRLLEDAAKHHSGIRWASI